MKGRGPEPSVDGERLKAGLVAAFDFAVAEAA